MNQVGDEASGSATSPIITSNRISGTHQKTSPQQQVFSVVSSSSSHHNLVATGIFRTDKFNDCEIFGICLSSYI